MKKLLLIIILFFAACNTSDLEDALDLAEGVDRKSIDVSRMGMNAFGNKNQFGSVCDQYSEVVNVLGVKYLRILVNWNNGVQSSKNSSPDFSFYDSLVNCIPNGADALLVVNGLPGWMNDSANWNDGNPRSTFVDLWFKKVVRRYQSNPKVIGFQVWNEPNMTANSENVLLDMSENSSNYLEMLSRAYSTAKDINSNKLVVNAATTAIAQNFRGTLNYNKQLQEQGVENFVDVYAIHYYGEQFENVLRDDGIQDFLNSLSVPIWITESGAQGVSNQLPYVETVWPFLREKSSSIDRIYYYQYASLTDSGSAYGLKNPSSDAPVSDLYVYLRDR